MDFENIAIDFNFTGPGDYYLWFKTRSGSIFTSLGKIDSIEQLEERVGQAWNENEDGLRELVGRGDQFIASRTGILTHQVG